MSSTYSIGVVCCCRRGLLTHAHQTRLFSDVNSLVFFSLNMSSVSNTPSKEKASLFNPDLFSSPAGGGGGLSSLGFGDDIFSG